MRDASLLESFELFAIVVLAVALVALVARAVRQSPPKNLKVVLRCSLCGIELGLRYKAHGTDLLCDECAEDVSNDGDHPR